MTWEEFRSKVLEELFKSRGVPNEQIVQEVDKKEEWLRSYYDKGVEDGNFEYAIDLAHANFDLWV